MKWDCGPSWTEKRVKLEDWHPWFAWRPIRVASHDCRWLESIDRKGRFTIHGWIWDYRAAVNDPQP